MAVIFDTLPVYSLLGDGRVLQTGNYQFAESGIKYCGGKIFYIDDTSEGGTYTFYSRTGKILTDIQVGDEPFAYKVTGTPNKDKYYIMNVNLVLSKIWTYKDSNEQWVYNLLGTTDGIGTGKTNTAIVMAADSGSYVNYNNTIWNSLNALNTVQRQGYGDVGDKGCNDWYCLSLEEIKKLLDARDRNGNPLITPHNAYGTSYEHDSMNFWLWNPAAGGTAYRDKGLYYINLIPTRSF